MRSRSRRPPPLTGDAPHYQPRCEDFRIAASRLATLYTSLPDRAARIPLRDGRHLPQESRRRGSATIVRGERTRNWHVHPAKVSMGSFCAWPR